MQKMGVDHAKKKKTEFSALQMQKMGGSKF